MLCSFMGGVSFPGVLSAGGSLVANRRLHRLPFVYTPTDVTSINEARNCLLHWKRDRFSLPVYRGQDVTTETGFRTCMDDVLRFIQVVPFASPTSGGKP